MKWYPVVEVNVPRHIVSPQMCEANKIHQTLQPVSIRKLSEDTWLVDMGRIQTGWFEMKMPMLSAGHEVTMEYSDNLTKEGELIINGKAPISGSKTDKSDTALTEINNDYKYGGSAADDNSGSLTYVKICYAGARSTADIEHNGLTLNGVGNGTKIENIYVLESADDAIEFFGGTVNVTNLLAVNPDDDMFDFTQGYCGTLKNCYGVWESDYTSTEADPRGIEADGNMDGLYPDHLRQSDFKVENMTIVNNAANTADNVDRMQDVIKIRRGAKATITNALVKGTGGAIDLVDMKDSKGAGNIESSINITSTLSLTGLKQNGELNTFVESADNTGADASLFGWTGYN